MTYVCKIGRTWLNKHNQNTCPIMSYCVHENEQKEGRLFKTSEGGIQILIKTGFEDLGIIKLFVRKLNDGFSKSVGISKYI